MFEWINGTVIFAERGMTGVTGNIYCGLHEFADMSLLLHFLSGSGESTNLFVDVGANVGSFTILAAGITDCQSVAIEPTPSTFKALKRNIIANKLETKVETYQVAVGEKQGTIRFSMDNGPMNQVVDDTYKGLAKLVEVRTLDTILDGRAPTMLKIDV